MWYREYHTYYTYKGKYVMHSKLEYEVSERLHAVGMRSFLAIQRQTGAIHIKFTDFHA